MLIRRLLKPALPALFALTAFSTGQAAAQTGIPALIETGKMPFSGAHAKNCQEGFERLFGVPRGEDPDEALIVRGATQTLERFSAAKDRSGDTLAMSMAYERRLAENEAAEGRITCRYKAKDDAPDGFAARPFEVEIVERDETRRLSGAELALF